MSSSLGYRSRVWPSTVWTRVAKGGGPDTRPVRVSRPWLLWLASCSCAACLWLEGSCAALLTRLQSMDLWVNEMHRRQSIWRERKNAHPFIHWAEGMQEVLCCHEKRSRPCPNHAWVTRHPPAAALNAFWAIRAIHALVIQQWWRRRRVVLRVRRDPRLLRARAVLGQWQRPDPWRASGAPRDPMPAVSGPPS